MCRSKRLQWLLGGVIGEIIGTGIIGSIASYPVMALLIGRTDLTWFFYTPGFLMPSTFGSIISYFFLQRLRTTGMPKNIQRSLGMKTSD